jgi:hypothetical protein
MTLRNVAYTLLATGIFLGLYFLFSDQFIGVISDVDSRKASFLLPLVTSLVTPMLTVGSTLLVIESLRSSNRNNFSNIFFKLVDQHHKLVENIKTRIPGVHHDEDCEGRAFFDDLCDLIAKDYYHFIDQNDEHQPHTQLVAQVGDRTGKALIVYLYDYYFQIHQSDLGHYFRNLYHIVRYIDESGFGTKFKSNHVAHLRAQLSNYELLLLTYNGLHDYGAKFYPLIEKYQLHKSINIEDKLPNEYEKRIIDINVLRDSYPRWDAWLEDCGIPKEQ